MKMWRAVARPRLPWMTAKGDRLTLFVATVRIVAVAIRKFDQRQMARLNLDTAQLGGLGVFQRRRRPMKFRRLRFGRTKVFQSVQPRRLRGWPHLRPVRTGKPQPPGAADRGVTRIG